MTAINPQSPITIDLSNVNNNNIDNILAMLMRSSGAVSTATNTLNPSISNQSITDLNNLSNIMVNTHQSHSVSSHTHSDPKSAQLFMNGNNHKYHQCQADGININNNNKINTHIQNGYNANHLNINYDQNKDSNYNKHQRESKHQTRSVPVSKSNGTQNNMNNNNNAQLLKHSQSKNVHHQQLIKTEANLGSSSATYDRNNAIKMKNNRHNTMTTNNDNNDHNKNKEFQCSECGKLFQHEHNLQIHMKMHNDEALKCPFCNKFFVRKANLLQHTRIHTDDRPWKCNLCGKAFRQKKWYDIISCFLNVKFPFSYFVHI